MRLTLPLKTPCVHRWDGDRHVHRCSGMPGCHEPPCACACGAECWCTAHITLDDRLTGRKQRHISKRPA